MSNPVVQQETPSISSATQSAVVPVGVGYLPVLNTLRALAALAVVLFHFLRTPNLIENQTIYGVAGFGALGVHVFFVISGIVIPLSLVKGQYSYRKFGRFMWKRALRIEPPYLISIVFFALYGIARTWLGEIYPTVGAGTYSIPDTPTIIAHIGYLVPFNWGLPYFKDATWLNGAYWTLAVEFQYYLLVAISFPLLFHRKAMVRLSCLLPMILSSTVLFETIKGPDSGLVFRWLPYFVVGIELVQYQMRLIRKGEYAVISLFALAVITWNESAAHALAASGVVLIVFLAPEFRTKWGDYFGDISYSLYLLHGLLGWSILNYVAGRDFSTWSRGLAVVVALAVSVVSAHLMFRFVETPSRKASKAVQLVDDNPSAPTDVTRLDRNKRSSRAA